MSGKPSMAHFRSTQHHHPTIVSGRTKSSIISCLPTSIMAVAFAIAYYKPPFFMPSLPGTLPAARPGPGHPKSPQPPADLPATPSPVPLLLLYCFWCLQTPCYPKAQQLPSSAQIAAAWMQPAAMMLPGHTPCTPRFTPNLVCHILLHT